MTTILMMVIETTNNFPKEEARNCSENYQKSLAKNSLLTISFAAILVVAGIVSVDLSGATSLFTFLKKAFIETDEKKLAIHLGVTLIVVWAFATFLLVINFQLVRVLEGYGALNPARLLKYRSIRMFDKLSARISWIGTQKPLSEALLIERRRLRMRLSNEFPESRHLILSTRFGNIVRAFERYPQVIYNIDAIRSWTRLQAVLPDGYKASLEAAKAILDFFVNLWFGATLIATIAFLRIIFIAVVGYKVRLNARSGGDCSLREYFRNPCTQICTKAQRLVGRVS